MQALLEYLPLVLFFVVYKMADIYWATGVLIVGSALHILYFIIRGEKVPTKQWVLFALIAGFGGLTIFLRDDTFLKWKVTIINEFFAIALLVSHYIFKKNLIQQLMGEAVQLPEKIWAKLNLAWVGFFVSCGALNAYIAFNFSQEVWVNFKVFGLMGLTFAFAVGTILSLHKYMPEEEKSETQNKTISNEQE